MFVSDRNELLLVRTNCERRAGQPCILVAKIFCCFRGCLSFSDVPRCSWKKAVHFGMTDPRGLNCDQYSPNVSTKTGSNPFLFLRDHGLCSLHGQFVSLLGQSCCPMRTPSLEVQKGNKNHKEVRAESWATQPTLQFGCRMQLLSFEKRALQDIVGEF